MVRDISDAQLDAAEARGRAMLGTGPRALAAHYDPAARRVAIDLANVEVDGEGFILHWPALEADLFVPALVAALFGTRAWMAAASARHAGAAKSPAKAAAARANGAKGGRPRKAVQA